MTKAGPCKNFFAFVLQLKGEQAIIEANFKNCQHQVQMCITLKVFWVKCQLFFTKKFIEKDLSPCTIL